ncbi:hypothetical protein KDA_40240 [Dictyobacter alpinus]|uniref:Uncharacterized protein n=1 Tax=Dictyobacter alpinus TaxID=2014873 RepID=A0A402BB83_9CHLR|nr:hypothetical protein KDA_40240 [Dictyobacter alpinus]
MKALIGVGLLDTSPTIVTVLSRKITNTRTHISITGMSKKNIPSQNFRGKQAAELVSQWLEEEFKNTLQVLSLGHVLYE